MADDSELIDVKIENVSNEGSLEMTSDAGNSNDTNNTLPVGIMERPKQALKRTRNVDNWNRTRTKKARNSGQEYRTRTGRIRPKREMKPMCTETCKLKCIQNFSEQELKQLFSSYWELANVEKQREFISHSIAAVEPKYQHVRVGGTRPPRKLNNAFYFHKNNEDIRVCKVFFINTLGINDRVVRTVVEKCDILNGTLMQPDKRGKHCKHSTLSAAMKQAVNSFIESIPQMDSPYTQANTTKRYIEGGATISSIHNDYVQSCEQKGEPYASYHSFYKIFTEDFNISFYTPKEDSCELCSAYENSNDEQKNDMKTHFDQHQKETQLSREEKNNDKNNFEGYVNVYNLQAAIPLPKGNTAEFYYTSKLNVYNFTIYDLKSNKCTCFVWDESNGNCGVTELGTCILRYLKSYAKGSDVIFYSDNCTGQQKNEYMLALYMYAILNYDLNSITHKYLIKGHTQNEGDCAQSLIEKETKRMLKSGPIYTPETFVSIVRSAKKKGDPYQVIELCYENFLDIKSIASVFQLTNFKQFKLSDVAILKVIANKPKSIFYKMSYSESVFQEAKIMNKKTVPHRFQLERAFQTKLGISEKKKADLMDLVNKNLIPSFYKPFFEKL